MVGDIEADAEVQKDLPRAGMFSLPLLAILLLIVFRSVIAAFLPLLIGGIAVLGAFSLTRVVTMFTDVSIFASNIIALLGLGLAIDYSLLFISRFRDELIVADGDVPTALACTIKTAGESIFLSGSTVALELARDFGLSRAVPAQYGPRRGPGGDHGNGGLADRPTRPGGGDRALGQPFGDPDPAP